MERSKAVTRTRPIAAAPPTGAPTEARSGASTETPTKPPPPSVPSSLGPSAQASAQGTADFDHLAAAQSGSSSTHPAASAAPFARETIALAAPLQVDHANCQIAEPAYPALSKRRGETGTVTVRFVIETTGAVGNVALAKSSGFSRLDDAAMQALKGSACRPYLQNGSPIRVSVAQDFTFGLQDE